MAALPILWIEARAHCHATEDEARVLVAFDAACPGDPPARDAFEGHFGNPIVRLTRHLEGSAAIRAAWGRWREAGILRAIADQVEDRVDEHGVLHFRLDKQAAFEGRLGLARDPDSIDVLVRLQAYPATPTRFRAAAHALIAEGL